MCKIGVTFFCNIDIDMFFSHSNLRRDSRGRTQDCIMECVFNNKTIPTHFAVLQKSPVNFEEPNFFILLAKVPSKKKIAKKSLFFFTKPQNKETHRLQRQ